MVTVLVEEVDVVDLLERTAGELGLVLDQILQIGLCLLYTSDAADERSSVDLGGRRIIKKKKKGEISVIRRREENDSGDKTKQ